MAYLDKVTINNTTYNIQDTPTQTGVSNVFSNTTAYTAGQYVWYDGDGTGAKLYRFTVPHAAGAWVGTDATQVPLANDVAGIKSNLEVKQVYTPTWVNKTINGTSGTESASETRMCTEEFIQSDGGAFTVLSLDGYKYSFRYYTSNTKSSIYGSTGWLTGENLVPIEEGQYFKVVASKVGDGNIDATTEGSNIVITNLSYTDKSLTIVNKAADSKTVGDKLTGINGRLDTYIENDSIIGDATVIKTLSDTAVNANDGVLSSVSGSKTAIVDVLSAPKIICNNSSNRFVTMFIDTPDAIVGTVKSPNSQTLNPGNNPTISNYVIPNPTRARYLAVWYTTGNYSFSGELTLVNDNLSRTIKNTITANTKDNTVRFNVPNGVSSPFNRTQNPCTYEVFGNSVCVDGTIGSDILRIVLYGDYLQSTVNAPTYANYPSMYSDPISDFVIGHKYGFKIDIVQGEYPSALTRSPYLDIRDKSGNVQQITSDEGFGIIQTWDCTFVPECILMGVRAGSYSNVVIQYTIVDMTALPENSIEANYLMEKIGYNYISKNVVINDITFVRGNISTTGASNSTATNRCRTSNNISFYGASSVSIKLLNNLYEYSLRYYDIKTNEFLRSDQDWSNADRTIEWNDSECVRIVIRLATDADIVNATLIQGVIGFEYSLPEIYANPTPQGFETVGNTQILAAKTLSFTDGTQPINQYYIVASPLTRIAYKTSDFNTYIPLMVLPFTFIGNYAYGVTYDDNILAIFTIQALNDDDFVDKQNGTDACRKPFYEFLVAENYQVAHKIDLTSSNKINPTGWLNNSGYYAYNGGLLFCEYTRTIAETCNIWKVAGDITNPANWETKLTLTLSGVNTGIKHMHCLVQDPYTNILYMSSGDDNDGAKTYYSTDVGNTWVLLHEGEEKYDRYLSLVFTEQYIYWATDSFRNGMHYLYRTIRDTNNVMSFTDIEIVQDLNDRLIATYGTIYLPTLNKLFLPERRDSANGDFANIITYDIGTDTISVLNTLNSTGNSRLGFRCNYIDYVARDNVVHCGFGPSFPLHNGGYPNLFNVFGNVAPGYPNQQCNNLVLRFSENYVSIDTNTH